MLTNFNSLYTLFIINTSSILSTFYRPLYCLAVSQPLLRITIYRPIHLLVMQHWYRSLYSSLLWCLRLSSIASRPSIRLRNTLVLSSQRFPSFMQCGRCPQADIITTTLTCTNATVLSFALVRSTCSYHFERIY